MPNCSGHIERTIYGDREKECTCLREDTKIEFLLEALEKIGQQQENTLKMIADNGFVFTSIGTEKGNWMHLAFSIYTDLCEVDLWAKTALAEYYDKDDIFE